MVACRAERGCCCLLLHHAADASLPLPQLADVLMLVSAA
jgi:hypothetical protein